MDGKINDILKDLYAADGGLRAHDKELRKLVAALLATRPDTRFDVSFAARLRSELVSNPAPAPVRSPYTGWAGIFSYRAFYQVATAALTILIVVPLTYVFTKRADQGNLVPAWSEVKDLSTDLAPKPQISDKGMNAFGTLDLAPRPSPVAKGAPSTMSLRATEGSSTMAADIAQGAISYAYAGGKVDLPAQGDVYRKSAVSASSTADAASIADVFLKGGAMDSKLYGKAVAVSESEVVYPLVIDGVEVYTETGEPFGLSVTVDPQERRVVGINNPLALSYESSKYPLETDFAVILAAATSSKPASVDANTEGALGTPRLVLMKYDGDLYVPALLFPATYKEGETGPKNVIVPIVKEFLAKIRGGAEGVAGVGASSSGQAQ